MHPDRRRTPRLGPAPMCALCECVVTISPTVCTRSLIARLAGTMGYRVRHRIVPATIHQQPVAWVSNDSAVYGSYSCANGPTSARAVYNQDRMAIPQSGNKLVGPMVKPNLTDMQWVKGGHIDQSALVTTVHHP